MRDPRNWVRPGRGGGRRRRRRHGARRAARAQPPPPPASRSRPNVLDLAERTVRDLADEARRLLPVDASRTAIATAIGCGDPMRCGRVGASDSMPRSQSPTRPSLRDLADEDLMQLVQRAEAVGVRGRLRPPRRRRLLARLPHVRGAHARRGRRAGGVPVDLAQRRPLRPPPRQRAHLDPRDHAPPRDRRAAPRRRAGAPSRERRGDRGALRGEERTDVEVARREEAREVRGALEALPADQRRAIELAYFGGFTQSEIAEMLERPDRHRQGPHAARPGEDARPARRRRGRGDAHERALPARRHRRRLPARRAAEAERRAASRRTSATARAAARTSRRCGRSSTRCPPPPRRSTPPPELRGRHHGDRARGGRAAAGRRPGGRPPAPQPRAPPLRERLAPRRPRSRARWRSCSRVAAGFGLRAAVDERRRRRRPSCRRARCRRRSRSRTRRARVRRAPTASRRCASRACRRRRAARSTRSGCCGRGATAPSPTDALFGVDHQGSGRVALPSRQRRRGGARDGRARRRQPGADDAARSSARRCDVPAGAERRGAGVLSWRESVRLLPSAPRCPRATAIRRARRASRAPPAGGRSARTA